MSDTDSDTDDIPLVSLHNLIPPYPSHEHNEVEPTTVTHCAPPTPNPVVIVMTDDAEDNTKSTVTKSKDTLKRTDQFLVCLCFLVIFVVCLSIGLYLYLAVYKPSKYDDRYTKATCTVINNRITSTCYINECDYYGMVTIIFGGKIKSINETLDVIKTDDFDKAETYLDNNYSAKTNITCYYAARENLPLRIEKSVLEGDTVAKGFGIFFWIVAGVFFVIFVCTAIAYFTDG